ncbi:tryptophan-rich sensory protein [Mycolicibacterium moriokaense]|nr:tryptophan-rich sensory protein [Mycolicibacterium moriokaense]
MGIRSLASTALAVTATGVLGGLASRPAQSAWYTALKKPPYQPPRQAFPIVWPILYADIAAVSASTIDDLEDRRRSDERRAYIAALSANLVLNASWSWLFFSKRLLGTSAIAAGVLTVSSADLTRRSIAVRGGRAAPLAAYPLWCAFATALSTHIWILNRR